MRGVRKSPPPANVSPDGQTPRSFADAEQEYLATLPSRPNKVSFGRTEYNRLDKAKLRQVMYGEQGSLCVYCEQELSEKDSPPKVEHWRPLSGDLEYAIHWRNLYLSCSTVQTCDGAKGARPLKADDADPDLPWPTDLNYQDLVCFTSGGEIYVRGDVDMDEATRRALELAIDGRQNGGKQCRAIPKLNHPTLVAARREALDVERERFRRENRTPPKDERQERASQLLGRERLPAFVSIRVAWLRQTMGRGR